MPAIKNSRKYSSQLFLSASIALATHTMAMDYPEDSHSLYQLGGAVAGARNFTGMPDIQDKIARNPQWANWLPSYKWPLLSATPYTLLDRTWEAASGDLMAISSLLFIDWLSTKAGMIRTTKFSPMAISNATWALSNLATDLASTNNLMDFLYRQTVSNLGTLGVVNPDTTFKRLSLRVLALAPMLASALPEAMNQYVLHARGYAAIPMEVPELNQHYALTFISASSSPEASRPNIPHIDLDFLQQKKTFSDPVGRLENALVKLDKVAKANRITSIRLYPAFFGDEKKGGKLALFVRPFFDYKPGPLVRMPGDYGSTSDKMWWTYALDKGVLHGVYNSDQYKAVKMANEYYGYGKDLLNPLTDNIIGQLSDVMSWVADGHRTDLYADLTFSDQMHSALEPAVATSTVYENLAEPGKPKQSTYYTVISCGSDGITFLDDSTTKRSALPLMTLNTRSHYSGIKSEDVLQLEKHTASSESRGVEKLASTAVRNVLYGYVTNSLVKARVKAIESLTETDAMKNYLELNPGATYEETQQVKALHEHIKDGSADLETAVNDNQAVLNDVEDYQTVQRLEAEISAAEHDIKTTRNQNIQVVRTRQELDSTKKQLSDEAQQHNMLEDMAEKLYNTVESQRKATSDEDIARLTAERAEQLAQFVKAEIKDPEDKLIDYGQHLSQYLAAKTDYQEQIGAASQTLADLQNQHRPVIADAQQRLSQNNFYQKDKLGRELIQLTTTAPASNDYDARSATRSVLKQGIEYGMLAPRTAYNSFKDLLSYYGSALKPGFWPQRSKSVAPAPTTPGSATGSASGVTTGTTSGTVATSQGTTTTSGAAESVTTTTSSISHPITSTGVGESLSPASATSAESVTLPDTSTVTTITTAPGMTQAPPTITVTPAADTLKQSSPAATHEHHHATRQKKK